MTATVPSTLDTSRAITVPALQAAVTRLDEPCRQVVAYHLGWCDEHGRATTAAGGKAVRPAIALLAAEAVGAPAEVALPGAVAVELVHNFSLVHDDLLDRDLERRHRRTVWAIWGPATAILVGDALLALAHEVLLESPARGAARAAGLLAATARELTRGQMADLAFETRADVSLAECIAMATAKTGSLLAASAGIGALLADAPQSTVDAMVTFGREFGLAFQFVDDVLGIWGDPAVTGKPVYSDLRARKKSLPVTYVATQAGADPELAEWLAGTGATDPTGEPSEERLAWVADRLDRAGARRWALAQAADRMELAERALAGVDVKPQVRGELIELAHYVVDRDA